jgi:hypothetical protein
MNNETNQGQEQSIHLLLNAKKGTKQLTIAALILSTFHQSRLLKELVPAGSRIHPHRGDCKTECKLLCIISLAYVLSIFNG